MVEQFLHWIAENDKAVVALSTIAMALFTGALVAATAALWWGGQRHSERELRAYVCVVGAVIERFEIGDTVRVTMDIKNAGKTPAFAVTLGATLDIAPIERREFPTYPSKIPIRSNSSLGPGNEIRIERERASPLDPDRHNDVARGKLGVFLFGQVRYFDVFNKERFVNFRFVALGEQLDFLPTEEGNESN